MQEILGIKIAWFSLVLDSLHKNYVFNNSSTIVRNHLRSDVVNVSLPSKGKTLNIETDRMCI
jgi:hypothetical protein